MSMEIAIILNSMRKLGDRYRLVLVERFGLNDGKPKTLEEVGRMLNVTRERIRQIEAKALRIIKIDYRKELFKYENQ